MASKASIVLLRGVNVGGHKAFKPSQLVAALKGLDVVNIGAAGTLIVKRARGEQALRKAILAALPFEAEMMICPAEELLALADGDPFGPRALAEGVKAYLTVLAEPPQSVPRFPLDRPAARDWEVRVLSIRGRYALSLCRTLGSRLGLYPNEVVEREWGVHATTRGWPTILSICEKLRSAGGPT